MDLHQDIISALALPNHKETLSSFIESSLANAPQVLPQRHLLKTLQLRAKFMARQIASIQSLVITKHR